VSGPDTLAVMAAGDDPLTNVKTSQEDSVRQAEAAFGGAAPSGPVGVPGSHRGTGRALRRFVVVFILFDLIAGIGVGAYLAVKAAVKDNSPSSPAVTIPAIPGVPSVPTTPAQPAKPAKPAQPASFLSASGLRGAKATAQRLAGRGARIQLARVTGDQLQVITRNGSGGKVVLVSAAITRAIDTPSGALTGNEFGFSELNPNVAGRIARTIDRRYHVPERGIDYMVVIRDPIDKHIQWLVYPRDGSGHFAADARGGSLRRVG
jgi:hypothetical protein